MANLKELIEWLKKCPPNADVKFSNNDIPERISSWRGDYSKLALSHDGTINITAENLLVKLQDCVGCDFDGYKGGEYTADLDTVIMCDNYGDYEDNHIIGGKFINNTAIIFTSNNGFWEI